MAKIKIRIKGHKLITLTRNYNSLSEFNPNKDDVGFNQDYNDFHQYIINSPCTDWTTDTIKILSLPDKGRLFVVENQYTDNPTYRNVTIGDTFNRRDLDEGQVLKFSAEGNSDNQFTETYITEFSFERFCKDISKNETITVRLNMIDNKTTPILPKIYTTDHIKNEDGTSSYTLHIEGREFTGEIYTQIDALENIKKASVYYSPFGGSLSAKGQSEENNHSENRQGITIPIGVYQCTIRLSAVPYKSGLYSEAKALIHYIPNYPNDPYGEKELTAVFIQE